MVGPSNAQLGERLASLEAKLDAQQSTLAALTRQDEEASRGRSRIYEGIEQIRLTLVTVNHRLDGLEATDRSISPTITEIRQLRERAVGAGTLGRWLWALGATLIGVAGWLAAAWTWMTGRPPP